MGMMFVAIGLFFSALTRNQIVAAIWTFVVLFLLVVLTLLLYSYAASQQAGWAEAVRFVAVSPGPELRPGPARPPDRSRFTFRCACSCSYLTVKVLEIRGGRR